MSYSLAGAAKATGTNKTTILRAIKTGKISGTRDVHTATGASSLRKFTAYMRPLRTPHVPQHDAMADVLVAELRTMLADVRADRDAWRSAHERVQQALAAVTLRLPPPDAPVIAMPMAQDAAAKDANLATLATADAPDIEQPDIPGRTGGQAPLVETRRDPLTAGGFVR